MRPGERERILDHRIQQRLQSDSRYRNAENAEQQAQAEEEITREEEARLDAQIERSYFARLMDMARL